MFKSILFVFASIVFLLSPVLFVLAQATLPVPSIQVLTDDSAVLPINGAVLYNNVYGKGNVTTYWQSVFNGKTETGWEWDWPKSGGPVLRSYPEVLVGRSPWSGAGGVAGAAGLNAGNQLPRLLKEVHQAIDFDFSTNAGGLWLGSFDFWITRSDHPTQKDIVSDLTIWTTNHGVKNPYKGRHTFLKIGGRTYEAIFETPKERPDKPWNTLCLVDTDSRNNGSLELGPLMDALIANGLAKPTDFLATVELGSEVEYGKGRTILRTFKLR
jgi:hypothetical protein